MKNKKIAFFIPNLQTGGAERVCCNLASLFAEHGYDVSIYLIFNDKKTIYSIDPRVKLKGTPPKRLGYFAFACMMWIKWLFNREKPDVLIGFMWTANILVSSLSKYLGIPSISTEHSNPEKAEISQDVWNLAFKYYKFSSRVITLDSRISDFMSRKLKIPKNQFTSIFHSSYEPPNSNNEIITSLPEHYFLAVGRFHHLKRFDRMIAVFYEVLKQFPEENLVICGDGEEKQKLMEQVRNLGIKNHVFFKGLIQNILPVYQHAKALLVMSKWEGFGCVILEAMNWGKCPVISYNVQYGPSNLITNGVDGIIVPQDSEEEFLKALIQYIKDPHQREFFQQNIPRKMEQFSPARIFREWEKVLNEIIK